MDEKFQNEVDGEVIVEPLDTDDGRLEARLTELAKLTEIEYDRQRQAAAKELNIRILTLDREVEARRPRTEQDAANNDIVPRDPEPFGEPVKTDDVLDEIEAMLCRYCVLPDGAVEAIACWILHTWTLDAFFVSPILCLQSATKRCGKSTALMVIGELVRRQLIATNVTPAALFRTIERYEPTLLLDEADAWLKSDNDELRGILNAGHTRRTASTLRLVGDQHEPKKFSTWAPKVVAGVGKLADTLQDRSIVIPLRRRRPDEQIKRLRIDRLDGSRIRSMAVRWAQDHIAALRRAEPIVPAELNDRAQDNWRPSLAIAETASPEWVERARRAAKILTRVDDDDESAGVQLLADLKALFENTEPRLPSATIVDHLAQLEDRPWPEWGRSRNPISTRAMARLLKPFEIRPRNIRARGRIVKGYDANDFADAFSRFPSATPLQPQSHAGLDPVVSATSDSTVADVSATCCTPVADKNSRKAAPLSHCSGVADTEPVRTDRRTIRI